MADNLIKIFKEGPEVSFKGSPTVSPTTAALCSSDPFFLTSPKLLVNYPLSIYFLALSQAPPEFALEIAIETPETSIPGKIPATAIGPKSNPIINGVPITIAAGANI